MQLKGKSAIVTGSTSGIGLGIAQALAAQGANIMLNGFGTAEEIEAAKVAVKTKAHPEAVILYSNADMTKASDIEAMVNDAKAGFGAVDIVVNNAGVQHTALVEEFPVAKWDMLLALLLSAAFHTTRLTVADMKTRKWGRIVNIASVHGLVASTMKSAYVSAKHGVVGLTKVVALETAGTGVTCNAICPGWVLTPLVQKQIDALAAKEQLSNEDAKAKLLGEKQPTKAFATPEEIGEFVLFLCSEGAQQITGAALTMDGGWSAQ